MPGPGQPHDPDNDDDLIGFVSPPSLQGRPRQTSGPETAPQEPPVLRPAFSPPPPIREQVRAMSAADAFAPRPHAPGPARPARERVAETDSFTLVVYVLILMTVPTLGVAGVIALIAVWGRTPPADPDIRSHLVYQTRTLRAAGAAAIVGVVLLAAPFALGVMLLFALAIWLLVRGAAGVWKLKAGRGVSQPLSWWI